MVQLVGRAASSSCEPFAESGAAARSPLLGPGPETETGSNLLFSGLSACLSRKVKTLGSDRFLLGVASYHEISRVPWKSLLADPATVC